MARQRKPTRVFLRKREYKNGTISLYLDFYPPIRNPRTGAESRREYLNLYLIKNPKSRMDKEANAVVMAQAEAQRAEREIAVLSGRYGFIDKHIETLDFMEYFKSVLKDHDQKWERVYTHFYNYTGGKCSVADVTLDFCNGFRSYLLDASKIHHQGNLSQNSAAGYWATFRAFLSIAYKEHFLMENLNDFLERIPTVETRRNYLTMDELHRLADTPCKIGVLKRASLFSCLTGLRISDILALKWENIERYQDGGHCIRLCTQKTDNEATLPISEEAYQLCLENLTDANDYAEDALIFKGLNRIMIQRPLAAWLSEAGITKHITFHCFRHTYATLLVSEGTNIYTVSKMLTHKNVATTQIYADLVDERKRQAAETIHLTKDKLK